MGALLGFSLAVPPGPMNAWIATAATRSFRAGTLTASGAMAADAVLGAAVYLLSRSFDLHGIVREIDLVGAVVLGVLGVRALRRPSDGPERPPDGRTVLVGLGVGLSNPYQVVWWLTAGLAFAYLGGLVLLAGLFGAIAVWVVVFPWAMARGVRRYPGLARAVTWVSGLLMLGFAVYFAYLAVHPG